MKLTTCLLLFFVAQISVCQESDYVYYPGGYEQLLEDYELFINRTWRSRDATEAESAALIRFVELYEQQTQTENVDAAIPILEQMSEILKSDEGSYAHILTGIYPQEMASTISFLTLRSDLPNKKEILSRQLPYVSADKLLREVYPEMGKVIGRADTLELAIEQAENNNGLGWSQVYKLWFSKLDSRLVTAKINETGIDYASSFWMRVPDNFDFALLYEYLDHTKEMILRYVESLPAGSTDGSKVIAEWVALYEDNFGCVPQDNELGDIELACASDRTDYRGRSKASGIDPVLGDFIISHHQAIREIESGANTYDVIAQLYNLQPTVLSTSATDPNAVVDSLVSNSNSSDSDRQDVFAPNKWLQIYLPIAIVVLLVFGLVFIRRRGNLK